ncbi:MAG: LytTR family transcriptional regulator [Paludibacteraceae bacterium]|nr:LytTR family transcriptional regulator [Paludibacteraceae bacterium]
MQPTVPKYINKKQNVVRLCLWTALYAELFITIYQPFNSRTWISGVTELQYFSFATLAVLVAMLVIALSRTIMYQYNKKHELTYIEYSIWVAIEILAMSSIYTVFPYIFIPSHREEFHFLSMFGDAVTYTTFILLIPYAILMMAFILQEQNRILVRHGLQDAPDRDKIGVEGMLNFYDDKGELKLSIRPESLYYIESADNYVKIHYLNSGKIQHFMLRRKMRDIEEQYKNKGLVRCHRSYIVSLGRVMMLKRSEDGLAVDFDRQDIQPIPVSRTYSQHLIEVFSKEAKII